MPNLIYECLSLYCVLIINYKLINSYCIIQRYTYVLLSDIMQKYDPRKSNHVKFYELALISEICTIAMLVLLMAEN